MRKKRHGRKKETRERALQTRSHVATERVRCMRWLHMRTHLTFMRGVPNSARFMTNVLS
jgi:hypothetical protein